VVYYPLDLARQHFLGRRLRLRTHGSFAGHEFRFVFHLPISRKVLQPERVGAYLAVRALSGLALNVLLLRSSVSHPRTR
jgi:hypothetical protein